MTIQTFNPPVRPSPGTRRKPEIKTLVAEFGDGYTQETEDGLNNIRRVMSLRWEVLTPAQADTIEEFLTQHRGTKVFLWTPSNSATPIRWTCKEWERIDDKVHSITATFRESFNYAT